MLKLKNNNFPSWKSQHFNIIMKDYRLSSRAIKKKELVSQLCAYFFFVYDMNKTANQSMY